MRTVKIDAALDAAESKPFTFIIRDKEWTAYGDVPGIVIMRYLASSDSDNPAHSAQATLDFLSTVVIEEEQKDFNNFLTKTRPAITTEELVSISVELLEAVAANPTEQSSD